MRRTLLIVSLFLSLSAGGALAQDSTINIIWPPAVYDVAGTVEVRGTVDPPDLQSYFLEVADFGAEEPAWIPVTLPRTNPVTDGVVGTWMTTLLPDGIYQLRLRVFLAGGEVRFATVGPLRVGNKLERPGGQAAAQVAPPVEVVVPLPTAAPPQDVVLPRPNPVNRLPLPVGGQIAGFSDDTVQFMRQAGMTWIKWQIPFVVGEDSLIDVARDRINWTHERGFNVLLSITGEVEELAARTDAEYFPLYAEFLGRITELQPDAIEVWNEQNLDREWPQGRINPNSYADMLRQAHAAIKAVDPQVMVIAGALAPTGAEGAFGRDRVWNDDNYYLGMANAGVADFADCIGVHYNEGIIPPQQQGGDPRDSYPTRFFPLMTNRAAFPFRGDDIPLCYTELGYLSPEGFGTLPAGFAWAANTSVQEQAAWLRDAIQIAGDDDRIAMIIVFNMDFQIFNDDPQAGYAVIRPDGSCPACQSIASLIS